MAHALTSLVMKIGLREIGKITFDQLPSLTPALITNPYIATGLILIMISMVLYYLILSRTKLSYAFLATRSLAYILVIFFSLVFLKEIIAIKTLAGIIIILIGIYLIS